MKKIVFVFSFLLVITPTWAGMIELKGWRYIADPGTQRVFIKDKIIMTINLDLSHRTPASKSMTKKKILSARSKRMKLLREFEFKHMKPEFTNIKKYNKDLHYLSYGTYKRKNKIRNYLEAHIYQGYRHMQVMLTSNIQSTKRLREEWLKIQKSIKKIVGK